MAALSFVLLAHLRVVHDLCADGVAPEDMPLAEEAIGLLTFTFVDNTKGYWRTAVDDLDLLLRMVPIADAGGDWQEFLRSARAAGGD